MDQEEGIPPQWPPKLLIPVTLGTCVYCFVNCKKKRKIQEWKERGGKSRERIVGRNKGRETKREAYFSLNLSFTQV